MSSTGRTRVRALCFDVFGTVVDWRGSIAREVRTLAAARGVRINATRLADLWRAGYVPAMEKVRSGQLGWTRIDELHRMILDEVLTQMRLASLDEADRAELTLAWHRLRAWPDSVRGITRLKRGYTVATLSNGNISLLNDLSKSARLPWDLVFSAELFGHYKPDPECYLGAVRLLDLEPGEVMLVAAHKSDLRAAADCGLQTALIERPLEYGRNRHPDPGPDARFDYNAENLIALAAQLGC